MKKSSPVDLATLYSGQARNAVDDSNRIMLPADWRSEGSYNCLFVVQMEDHLLACPPPVWAAVIAGICASTPDKTQIPDIERELNFRSRRVSLDRFGRLPLPREFTCALQLKQQAVLVGRFSKFEIWPAEGWDKPTDRRASAAALVSERLKFL